MGRSSCENFDPYPLSAKQNRAFPNLSRGSLDQSDAATGVSNER